MKRATLLVILLVSLLAGSAWARTAVLIYGMVSNPDAWYKHKVIQPLLASGWADGGMLPMLPNWAAQKAPDVVYTVRMPWWLPLEAQARYLDQVLRRIYALRKEPVILVGHSSGGIVARLYSLAPEKWRVPVAGVITIASPNLGTPWAKLGWQMLRSPMGRMLKEMDDKSERLYAARYLLWELASDKRGNTIHRMAYMRHPEGVKYISLVHMRKWGGRRMDDWVGMMVPPKYQDLRRVPALSGRAMTIPVSAGHQLDKRDGWVLAQLLRREF
ncbi:PGAP1-like protein [Sulfurivirga caldicuralii]|uniref:PGAP1-like protein n=1 Tax=Sulfurivirga caldicuralii TaxID=364032 RepID=A0A1N6GSW8_9GAMM|nr:alpha/beta hydrolase [Sulfurivirga caldicuralii]SIO10670.1 PGAP1-like protein [Sulfurivirga caldicuralii]